MATITYDSASGIFIVRWTNVGNTLRNEPRWFRTLDDAERFCRNSGLRLTPFACLGCGQ